MLVQKEKFYRKLLEFFRKELLFIEGRRWDLPKIFSNSDRGNKAIETYLNSLAQANATMDKLIKAFEQIPERIVLDKSDEYNKLKGTGEHKVHIGGVFGFTIKEKGE